MKTFRNDFIKFYDMLYNGENFAFSRFSDGEMYILQNKKLVLDQNLIQIGDQKQHGPYQSQDFKHFDPEIHPYVNDALIKAFKHRQYNYFKGISCACCVGEENFKWQLDLHDGDDDSLTWANLWVNGNYPLFMENVYPLFFNKKCVFVGHKDANIFNMPFFVKDFRVGYNAMVNDIAVISDIKKWIGDNNITDHLFLFSASSFSNLAIYELYKEYQNNTYIDIGTTLAPLMNMPTQRSYLQAYWNYTKHPDLDRICIWK
jgi:hypothetical protein